MSKKITKIKSGSLQVYHGENLIRLEMFDDFFNGKLVATFFVPKTTVDKFGFVPDSIVRSRLKHDFNIEIVHYSVCHSNNY